LGTQYKVILITGAGKGIGKACVKKFIANGYKVGLIGRNENNLKESAKGNPNTLILPCDVAKPENVTKSFKALKEKWGRLDVLFNNAGIGNPSKTPDKITFDEWRNVIDINLNGSFLCAKAAFELMKEQKPQGGRIINNGSVSAHVPRPGSAPYTASKHAITGLTRSISLDGRPFNITCSQIDIGNALTEMAEKMAKGVPQANGSIKPEATMDPDHVAESVLNMANFPLNTNVQFMTLMATKMPYIGRG